MGVEEIVPEIEQSSRLLSYECIVSRVPTAMPVVLLQLSTELASKLSLSLSLGLLHAPARLAQLARRVRATLNYLVNEITSRVEPGVANSSYLEGLESLSLSQSRKPEKLALFLRIIYNVSGPQNRWIMHV